MANNADAIAKLINDEISDEKQRAKIWCLCKEAKEVRRTFTLQHEQMKVRRERLDEAEQAVRFLRHFDDKIGALFSGNLDAKVKMPEGDKELRQRALYSYEIEIAARRRTMNQTPARLGITRNDTVIAAQNAALNWMSEGMERITGKPRDAFVAGLAGELLGATVTSDRVRSVRRQRKDWREL